MLFVGHKITANGLEADPSKVRAILHTPEPKCVADIHRVLGMTNYLFTTTCFIHHATERTAQTNGYGTNRRNGPFAG